MKIYVLLVSQSFCLRGAVIRLFILGATSVVYFFLCLLYSETNPFNTVSRLFSLNIFFHRMAKIGGHIQNCTFVNQQTYFEHVCF